MSEPLNSRIDPDSQLRYYTWGEHKLTSVTSLRRTVGMSFQLHNWAVGQFITAATEMRHMDDYAELPDDEYRKAIRRAGTNKRDSAASLGSAVHDAADQGIRPAALPDEDERKPFLERYYAAMKLNNWKLVMSEFQVFNLDDGYAGSGDLIVYEPDTGDYILLDIKTGRGVYPDAAMQLELYRTGEFVGGYDALTEEDTEHEEGTEFLKAVNRMGVLHLRPDGLEDGKGNVLPGVEPEDAFIEVAITEDLTFASRNMLHFAKWIEQYPTMKGLTK